MFDFNKNINEELSARLYNKLKKMYIAGKEYDKLRNLERMYAEQHQNDVADDIDVSEPIIDEPTIDNSE